MNKNRLSSTLLSITGLSLVGAASAAYLVAEIKWIWITLLSVAVVSGAWYFFIERTAYGRALQKKTTLYGINAVGMSLFALVAFVLINYIATNYDVKADITKNKLHTLSDQTIKILKGLKTGIKLKVFVNPNQSQEFEQVLGKYTYESKLITREFIDVDKDPLLVQQYKIKQAGVIVVESESRQHKIENLLGPDDAKIEEKLTNALIAVTKGDKKKIYYISGHGERPLSDSGRNGYSEMKEAMEGSRYKIEELVLAEKTKVPEDAELLLCAGPKSDFLDVEIKHLEDYMNRGGKLLLMLEPNGGKNLQSFVAKYGVQWKPNKAVVETNPLQQLAGGNPVTPIVRTFTTSHEITSAISNQDMSIFAIATPIEKAEKPPTGYTVTSLFSTSQVSFESDLANDRVKIDQKKDRKGPLSLAVAITGKVTTNDKEADKTDKANAKDADKTDKEGKKNADKKDDSKTADSADKKELEFRMVVVGDSDFANNSFRRFGVNADLFQNMLSWLAKEEDLISIRPKPTDASEFNITETRFRVIHLASTWILPALMLCTGLAVWLVRRRK